MTIPENSILLVLDDEPLIVRLIVRSFGKDFKKILYASTPEQAETMLNDNPVTHFVCDANLGPNNPPGIELINRWYGMYPHMKKAVLFTGMAIGSVSAQPGIKVISKSDSPKTLLNHLKETLQPPAFL